MGETRNKCEMISNWASNAADDVDCGKPAVATTTQNIAICFECAVEMEAEGFMPEGWREGIVR